MLKLSVLISCAFALFSCNKSSNSDPQPTTPEPGGLVKSYLVEQPRENQRFKQTFQYDTEGNVIKLSYQSEFIDSHKIIDSGSFYFSYEKETRLMLEYVSIWRKDIDIKTYADKHVLLYDIQKRVVADSTTERNGVVPEMSSVSRFSYQDPYIVMKTGNTSGRIDSLVVVKGNVTREAFYTYQGAVTQPDYTDYFTPNNNFTNPFYDAKMPATISIFLTQLWFNDWVSKDLPDWISENMTWTKDSQGRIISGSGDAGTKLTFEYE